MHHIKFFPAGSALHKHDVLSLSSAVQLALCSDQGRCSDPILGSIGLSQLAAAVQHCSQEAPF